MLLVMTVGKEGRVLTQPNFESISQIGKDLSAVPTPKCENDSIQHLME